MKWLRYPTTFGWWFFVPDLRYWDLAMPVRVERHETNEVWFESMLPSGPARITPDTGWWYGPIVIARPAKNSEE